ncbi:hypothetical protein RIF29_24582 [Crotalaria pallida]|uniref:Uncharacterized protein n=1 Tax=Crotalaria pallida TaxID=3830 RepID=A0AAN9EKQ4_CROPI
MTHTSLHYFSLTILQSQIFLSTLSIFELSHSQLTDLNIHPSLSFFPWPYRHCISRVVSFRTFQKNKKLYFDFFLTQQLR